MNNLKLFFVMMLGSLFSVSFAQMHQGHGGYNPDSLEVVTVEGYAIVDTNFIHPMYFLDEDNDGVEDYLLNFGPYWYEPDSSNATRPNDGDYITITGGLVDTTMWNIPAVIVYEINGEFWRDPYDPFWNEMGHHGANCGHEMDSCHTIGFGWQHDPPQTVSISGYALLDSTFMMVHYYLDEDNDGTPDYFLNFGPPWYEPNSGAVRPVNGEQIDIVGGFLDNGSYPMVVVYEINGLFWQDSTFFSGNMSREWIHRYMTQPQQFENPFDQNDWMQMNPGWWMMGGGGQGGMHDSLFCQIFEILPGGIFELGNENAFAGYEVDYFFAGMMGGGMGGMGCGNHMQFASNADFQFHYTDAQLNENNIDESSVQVKYWDGDLSNWSVVSNATLNTNDNTISFSNDVVGNFFILTGDNPTSVETGTNLTADNFKLLQNYPNPFNPTTTIEFSVPEKSNVALSVYNLLGERVDVLTNSSYDKGSYKVSFDASKLASGVYIYQLHTNSVSIAKKMQLIK